MRQCVRQSQCLFPAKRAAAAQLFGSGDGSTAAEPWRRPGGYHRINPSDPRPIMIAVIFEVWPAQGQRQTYLDLAAALRGDLEAIEGFISIERFESLSEDGKILSLSFWRDEDAVARWRNWPAHRETQARGRAVVFRDYRLRIAAVDRDYGMTDRAEAPADSRLAHDPG
jgi:heme-degrading monooxygenase HmoA